MYVAESFLEVQGIVPGGLVAIILCFVKGGHVGSAFGGFIKAPHKSITAEVSEVHAQVGTERKIFQEIEFEIHASNDTEASFLCILAPVEVGIGTLRITQV